MRPGSGSMPQTGSRITAAEGWSMAESSCRFLLRYIDIFPPNERLAPAGRRENARMARQMAAKTQLLLELLQGQPVIPVVTLERLADAVPLARALARGGLPAIEITLRSNVALDAIRLIGAEVAEAAVGAGTVLTPEQLEQAGEAGARFAVSPGTTLELLAAARGSSLPYLPGAATPS